MCRAKGRCYADGVAVLAGHLHEATDGVTNEAQQVTQRDGAGVERLLGRAAEHLHQRGCCHGGGASHLGLAAALGAGDAGARGEVETDGGCAVERVHDLLVVELKVIGERQHAPIQKLKFKALTNLFTISGQKVLVMKPITYMNLSGEAVRQAVDFYKIPPDHVLVVSDDTALPLGRLRIRKGGSAGGHNGLKSIIQHLGTDQFPRLRVGVGEKPHPDYDMADWVLSTVSKTEWPDYQDAMEHAAEAALCIVKNGCEKAAAEYNGKRF